MDDFDSAIDTTTTLEQEAPAAEVEKEAPAPTTLESEAPTPKEDEPEAEAPEDKPESKEEPEEKPEDEKSEVEPESKGEEKEDTGGDKSKSEAKDSAPDVLASKVKISTPGGEREATVQELVDNYQAMVHSTERYRVGKEKIEAAETLFQGLEPDAAFSTLHQHWARKLGDPTAAREKLVEQATEFLEKFYNDGESAHAQRDAEFYKAQAETVQEKAKREAEERDYNDRLGRADQVFSHVLQESQIEMSSPWGKKVNDDLSSLLREGHEITIDLAREVVQRYSGERDRLKEDVRSSLTVEDLLADPELTRQFREKDRERLEKERASAGPETPRRETSTQPAGRRSSRQAQPIHGDFQDHFGG